MNVLIVFAHPESKSFNGAMKDIAIETLSRAGHEVVVSDLYAMRFNPVVGLHDFSGERADPAFFSVQKEQTTAYETGTLATDIAGEMAKLKRADLVIFQFPIWWFGMPAILKGWADRIFARGFAYLPGRKYDTGMFRGKTAMIAATTGTSADTYAPDGITSCRRLSPICPDASAATTEKPISKPTENACSSLKRRQDFSSIRWMIMGRTNA